MRDLVQVIDLMLAEVPAEEKVFRERLLDCRSSAAYSAPELMGCRWRATANVLLEELGAEPKPEGTWQRRVKEVWFDGPAPDVVMKGSAR